ncbi:hypothetical protein CEE44_04250 [Candidatus Woesearchaeota archaeon B3_Woes]|nr:MAG: hypothetical protein CEE44_04250 [Candidatus Woesearchaeota archaeon B3_Woes]
MDDKQPSGLSAEELFERGIGITYDDFTILDTIFTDIDREDITLKSELGNGIYLQTPIIASPMDTVTNAELCIAIALEGGIGCIHYNYKNQDGSSDIDEQIREIERVKRFKNGFIEHPITVSSDQTIGQVIELIAENRIGKSGFKIDTFPVTYAGEPHGRLVGLLRKQDYSRTQHRSLKVRERMLPLEKLIKAEWPITLQEANKILWDSHISSLCVTEGEKLKYLVTRSDLDKHEEYPLATIDDNKRLRVLFAVGTRPEQGYEILERGFAAGADGCIVDTSQGFTKHSAGMLKYIIKNYSDKLIIGGNISTKEAYEYLNKLGTHADRDGQGGGSICTTAGSIGIARAAAAAVYHCAKQQGNMRTLADGGIKHVGDIVKAQSNGASIVVLGKMLAGTEESPGETIVDPESGLLVKIYRGMGSPEANVGGIRGYKKLPQGITGHVQYRGSIHKWIPLIRDGMISAYHVLNCRDINELHKKVYNGEIRFERRTIGSSQESKTNVLK